MLRVVVPANKEPVSLEMAKKHLRVDTSADDSLIELLITAGREVVEQQTGYALVEATYEWSPTGPSCERPPIEPSTITSGEGVFPIRFVTTPGETPAALRAAILLLVGDTYAIREAGITGTIHVENPAVDRLTFPYRRFLP
ncbi:Phage gp6-like head-tail connector protein [compost metagenome]